MDRKYSMRAHKLMAWAQDESEPLLTYVKEKHKAQFKEAVIYKLRLAVNFDLGDLHDAPEVTRKINNDTPFERLFPANPFLYQFFIRAENTKEPQQLGCYMYILGYHNEGEYEITVFIESLHHKQTFTVGSVIFTEDDHESAEYSPAFNEEGSINNLQIAYEAVVAAYMIMRCDNIYKEKVPAPVKLNKKRVKSGKPVIDEYYTLNIGRVNSKGKCVPLQESSKSKGLKKLHFCRGFVRRLNETRTTWVRGHWRGNKKNGVIIKDYSYQQQDEKDDE